MYLHSFSVTFGCRMYFLSGNGTSFETRRASLRPWTSCKDWILRIGLRSLGYYAPPPQASTTLAPAPATPGATWPTGRRGTSRVGWRRESPRPCTSCSYGLFRTGLRKPSLLWRNSLWRGESANCFNVVNILFWCTRPLNEKAWVKAWCNILLVLI